MIQKIIDIEHKQEAQDSVALNWFDMQKPNLSAVSEEGVSFMMKVKFTHLHENDVLISDAGHRIQVKKSKDRVYRITFDNHMDFARAAYEIGNRHQPICLEDYVITVLDDISLSDIIEQLKAAEHVDVVQTQTYFSPNGKAHHSH